MNSRPWIRIVGPLLLFAVIGSVGVALLLNAAFQRVSHTELSALTEADADFIRDTIESEGQPKTTADFLRKAESVQARFLSGHLSQLHGAKAEFRRVPSPDSSYEAITVPLNSTTDFTLTRERPHWGEVLLQPISLGALIAFWALWFALAWSVTLPYLNAHRFGLLGSMATSLAHEIRNPIAAIRLHGQLLEQNEPVSGGLIVYEAAKIEDMLNQWMFLARPEPPRKREIALEEVVAQTVRVLKPAADHANVRIDVEAWPDRRVKADEHRLSQVFHNIVLNSIQAMPQGGTITITISEKDVQFCDTGPGFSRVALRRASNGHYSEKEGGMGLGLNVARKILRAHDGRLVIANGAKGGASVRVVL